jgi:hypothetical protein
MQTINITAHTEDDAQIDAIKAVIKAFKIKYSISKPHDLPYNPNFVAKIEKSRKQAAEGKTVKISLDDIWK